MPEMPFVLEVAAAASSRLSCNSEPPEVLNRAADPCEIPATWLTHARYKGAAPMISSESRGLIDDVPTTRGVATLTRVTAGMMMSLDGFVTDRQSSACRLYPDLADLRETSYMNTAIEQTGAVVMGRRTFEMNDPDSYLGSYEFQVPIFVVTHHPPEIAPKQDDRLTFTFVTDGVESAAEQAKAAAGMPARAHVELIGEAWIEPVLIDGATVLRPKNRIAMRETKTIGARPSS